MVIADEYGLGLWLLPALRDELGFNAVRTAGQCDRLSAGDILIIASVGETFISRQAQWAQVLEAPDNLLVPVHFHEHEVIIGPLSVGRDPSCGECWATRYYMGRPAIRNQERALAEQDRSRSPWMGRRARTLVASFLALLIASLKDETSEKRQSRHGCCTSIDLISIATRNFTSFPNPTCAECSALPMDSSDRVAIHLERAPKHPDAVDRTIDIRTRQELIFSTYLGYRSGLVSRVESAYNHVRGAVAISHLTSIDGRHAEPCSGFSDRYTDARLTSVLEAVERWSGSGPKGSVPCIRDSRQALENLAIDPSTCGLYTKADYRANEGVLVPYSPEIKVPHVWGHSLRGNNPILVPQQLAYYSLDQSKPIYVIESSSGCALGNGVEEALLHGLLELAERDAALMAWYCQDFPISIDLSSIEDLEVRHRLRRLKSEGYAVSAFDVSNDLRIPAVVVTVLGSSVTPVFSVWASAAHFLLEKATKKALRELDANLGRFMIDVTRPEYRERIEQLNDDPSRVNDILDHGLLYCSPRSAIAIPFTPPLECDVPVSELQRRAGWEFSDDVSNDLGQVIERVIGKADDIIAINQTSPDQEQLGLRTYRVLAPGTIPASWGARRRRITGLPRLQKALLKSSTQTACLTDQAVLTTINPAPHPYL